MMNAVIGRTFDCYIMYGVRYDLTSIFQDLIRKLFPSQKCCVYTLLYYGIAGKPIECRIDLNMDQVFFNKQK